MKMDAGAYARWENKAITLVGMSGVGKTTLANALPKTEWFHFSGDYRIGTKYLEEPILDNIKKQAMQVDFLRDLLRSDSIYICSNVTVHNLAPLSTFLGKVGDPRRGGLPLAEFKRRQRLHHEAEIGAMRDVVDFIAKSREIYGYPHFLNDAGGSLCELGDPRTLEMLAEHTLMLYLQADEAMEAELTRRAVTHPKPLYFNEQFFDSELERYLAAQQLQSVEEIDPDAFAAWIFPRLVEHRRPLYEDIARRYGYAVNAADAASVRDESDFTAMITAALRAD